MKPISMLFRLTALAALVAGGSAHAQSAGAFADSSSIGSGTVTLSACPNLPGNYATPPAGYVQTPSGTCVQVCQGYTTTSPASCPSGTTGTARIVTTATCINEWSPPIIGSALDASACVAAPQCKPYTSAAYTVSCPAGYTGTKTFVDNYTCPSATGTPVKTSSAQTGGSCTAIPAAPAYPTCSWTQSKRAGTFNQDEWVYLCPTTAPVGGMCTKTGGVLSGRHGVVTAMLGGYGYIEPTGSRIVAGNATECK